MDHKLLFSGSKKKILKYKKSFSALGQMCARPARLSGGAKRVPGVCLRHLFLARTAIPASVEFLFPLQDWPHFQVKIKGCV